jgi:hypothetical protein
MLEHDLRHERSRLQIAPSLELEEITLGADHGAFLQAIEKAYVGHRFLLLVAEWAFVDSTVTAPPPRS